VKNIFVGNLDSGTTVASIRSFFEPHGTIRFLKLMTDRESGVSRGFAFVEMPDDEADRAIAVLNGSTIDGRTVDVHEGRPRLHAGSPPRERHVPRPQNV
jgi:cold-inducible RNA-binding protein